MADFKAAWGRAADQLVRLPSLRSGTKHAAVGLSPVIKLKTKEIPKPCQLVGQ